MGERVCWIKFDMIQLARIQYKILCKSSAEEEQDWGRLNLLTSHEKNCKTRKFELNKFFNICEKYGVEVRIVTLG